MIDVIFAVGLIILFPNGGTAVMSDAYPTRQECMVSRAEMLEAIAKAKKHSPENKYFAGECTAIPVKEE